MILYMRSSCTLKSKLLLKDIFQYWYTSYFEPVEIHNVNIEIHSSYKKTTLSNQWNFDILILKENTH